LAASLLLIVGCQSEQYIKPKPGPEELRVPPLEESRYSKPPEFPKGTLNQDTPPKTGNDPASLKNGGAGGGPRMGGGPGGY
jgi:hypothetical protein